MRIQVGTEVRDLGATLSRIDKLSYLSKSAPVRKGIGAAVRYLQRRGAVRLRGLYKGYQTGRLYKSMTSRVKRRKAGGLAGFRRGKGGGNHAHLVDRGTTERYTRSGAYRGRMPANGFWTTTKQIDSGRASEMVIQGLQEAVSKI